MKHKIILLSLVGLLASFNYEDCYREFDRIMAYYKDADYENFHMTYNAISSVNGTETEILHNEIKKNKTKMKFANQYMEMYQDEKSVVMVSYTQKQISIQKLPVHKKMDVSQMTTWYQNPDTLRKYYKPLQCQKNAQQGQVIAELKDIYKDKSSIRRMVFYYEPKSGKILKCMIESEQQGTVRQEIMDALTFKSGQGNEPFKGAAAGLVATSAWKEKFKAYKIIDLRSK